MAEEFDNHRRIFDRNEAQLVCALRVPAIT
jgi:hypothetical protein